MTSRIQLRPIRDDDADVMAGVLGDPALYAFTGGEPPSVDDLRRRYAIQARGQSSDGSEEWINLLVTLNPENQPIGYVQATVPRAGGPTEIAWVIGTSWQGRGFATEASRLLLSHLQERGVRHVIAHIHPDHEASQRVAAKIGLARTDIVVDGEIRWERGTEALEFPSPE